MWGLTSLARYGGWCILTLLLAAPSTPAQLITTGTTTTKVRTDFDKRLIDYPISFVGPDDPGLSYTEYVNATITPVRATFDRLTVVGQGNLNSPGTRINFSTDALRVRILVEYHGAFPTPGSGLFRLELDGVLQPGGIGSDTDVGVFWYLVHSQLANHGRRNYSLLFPLGANVDFLGMELTGATPGPLGPPPSRPPGVIVAYGDSITHGFKASSIAEGYPYLVGKLQQRSVINMGFVGQVLTAEDGTAVGNLGGESVSLAIGTNDWTIDTTASSFLLSYETLLDNIRAIQPSVPIFVITPTWVATEGVLNTIGLTREDYRQLIRDVVLPRTITDPELYLIEGSVLVPPGLTYFPDGIHPNDSGFAFFATALGGNNLVADPGFETEAYAWADLGNSTCVSSDVQSGLKALQVGTGAGGRTQPVGRLQRATGYAMSAWSKVGAAGEIGTFGISFYDELGMELSKQTIQITSTTYQEDFFPVFTPAVFAYAEVWCKKDTGPSFVYVDDFELAKPSALSMQFLGDGRPGTLGVPSLGASTPTLASTTVSIDVGNSLGQPTGGVLLLWRQSPPFRDVPERLGPPTHAIFSVIPASGLRFPVELSNTLIGDDRFLLQIVQRDPGAAGGISASRLLSFTAGN